MIKHTAFAYMKSKKVISLAANPLFTVFLAYFLASAYAHFGYFDTALVFAFAFECDTALVFVFVF